jgi:hypothetical protein
MDEFLKYPGGRNFPISKDEWRIWFLEAENASLRAERDTLKTLLVAVLETGLPFAPALVKQIRKALEIKE